MYLLGAFIFLSFKYSVLVELDYELIARFSEYSILIGQFWVNTFM